MRLLTFLIGLNDSYEATRTQIMLIKPLPTLDGAYSMIVQVEDQRQLNEGPHDGRNLMTMNVVKQPSYNPQTAPQQHYGGNKPPFSKQGAGPPGSYYKKRISKEDKKKLKCTHCQGMRHEVDDCFKLHGILEWYTKLKKAKSCQPRAHYAEVESPNEGYTQSTYQKDHFTDMSKLIQSEIAKCMRSYMQQHAGPSTSKNDANLVHDKPHKPHPFDGHYAFAAMPIMEPMEWIIDSGASFHICCVPGLLHTTYKLDNPTSIFLPDGSSREVAYAGKAIINKDLVLHDVLYVPGFTNNLISISQLVRSMKLNCVFLPTHCFFRRSTTLMKLLE